MCRLHICHISTRGFALWVVILVSCSCLATPRHYNVDSLLQVLDAVIDSSTCYDARLYQDLVSYKTAYDNAEDDETRFGLTHTLFKTYRKLRLDSALYFARQRVQIAQRLGIPDSLLSARIDEADALKCLGRPNDALAVLDAMPRNEYIRNNAHYYSLYHSTLLSLSQMTTDDLEVARYKPILMHYRDTINLVNSHDTLTVCVNTCALNKSRGRFKEALAGLLRFGDTHSALIRNSAIYWYELAFRNDFKLRLLYDKRHKQLLFPPGQRRSDSAVKIQSARHGRLNPFDSRYPRLRQVYD